VGDPDTLKGLAPGPSSCYSIRHGGAPSAHAPEEKQTTAHRGRSNNVPRPSKAIKRQRVNAATAWKKGEREEARKLWTAAAAARNELQIKKKRAGKKPAAGGEAASD